MARHRQARGELGGVVRSVLARRLASAGSLSAAISARAASGPSVSHHSAAIHSGCEWRSAAACGVSSGSASTIARASRAARRRTALTRPAPPRDSALASSTDSPTAAWAGHAIEVGELEGAEPQRGHHGGFKAVDRAVRERLDDVVEGGASLDGAVRQLGRETEVARVEFQPLSLAAEGTIGPRGILENPPQDGESGTTGGRGHRTDVQIREKGLRPGAHMPTKSVMGQHIRRSEDQSSRARGSAARRSDLRFAGMISAGMIATVVTIGALLAPLLAWNDGVARNAGDRSQTLRLSDLPKQGTAPRAAAESFAVDRPGHHAAQRVREALSSRDAAAGAAPRGGSTLGLDIRKVSSPRRTAPLANASDDSDGDGMPDIWERANGLNPNDAADAAEDTDGDGLNNLTEMRVRTGPRSIDSDRNGVQDGDEDSDNDGLRNKIELAAGADPAVADSNNDGINDGDDDADGDGASNLVEQAAGTDPGSGEDVPPILGGDDPTPIAPPRIRTTMSRRTAATPAPRRRPICRTRSIRRPTLRRRPAPDIPTPAGDEPAGDDPPAAIPRPADDDAAGPTSRRRRASRRRHRGQADDEGAATTPQADDRPRPAPTPTTRPPRPGPGRRPAPTPRSPPASPLPPRPPACRSGRDAPATPASATRTPRPRPPPRRPTPPSRRAASRRTSSRLRARTWSDPRRGPARRPRRAPRRDAAAACPRLRPGAPRARPPSA